MDALRSALQPITRKLPTPIRDVGVSILGKRCYRALVLDMDLETECVKLAVSKGLGYGIIAASSIVKVPQIVKLVRSQSASGLSALSYFLETGSYLISLAYNVRNGFPFSTFGETGLILIQNIIIMVLLLNYSGRSTLSALFVAALAVSVVILFNSHLDMNALGHLQEGASLLGVSSKIPQILAIWQQGGTGQLSAFTVLNYLAGSLSRIFTTLQEVDDKRILYSFMSGFALNLVLALQMVYYWNTALVKAKGKKADLSGQGTFSATTTPKGKGPTTRRRG